MNVFDTVDKRFEAVEKRLDQMEKNLTARFDDLKQIVLSERKQQAPPVPRKNE
jgi:flagellar capping protein FliD